MLDNATASEVHDRREALGKFCEGYHRRAYTVALGLCRNPAEAEELVQEALYRALRCWRQYDRKRSLEAWFLAVLENVFIDGWRRKHSRTFVSLDELLSEEGGGRFVDVKPSPEASPLEHLEAQEVVREVHATLRAMKKPYRRVLILCYLQGYGYREIAEKLGAPLGTIRSRMSRARTCFKAAAYRRRLNVH